MPFLPITKEEMLEREISVPDDEAPLGLKTRKNQVLTAFAAFC